MAVGYRVNCALGPGVGQIGLARQWMSGRAVGWVVTRGTRGGAGTRVGFVAGGHVGEDVLPEGSQSGLGSEAEVPGSVEATGNGASLKLTSVLALGDGENVLHRPQPGEVVVVGGADGSGLDVGGDEDRSGDAASRGGVVCVEGRRRSFPFS